MPPIELKCTVRSFKMITETVFLLGFTTEPEIQFKAGQFISIIIPGAGPGGRDLRRAYSIASTPEESPIELCIKIVDGGPGTSYLKKLRAGDEFKGNAPFGDFVYKTQPARDVYFLATGTGVAPFRAILASKAYLAALAHQAVVLHGVRDEGELLYAEELKGGPAQWMACVSRPAQPLAAGKHFYKGRLTDYLREHAATVRWADTDFYLCGNGEMILEVRKMLEEKGVAKSAIHQEKYY